MPEDFWPDIAAAPIRAPATILMEQAPLLGEKTRNVVTARVRRLKMQKPTRFGYAFEVVAPALNNYAAILFKIAHDFIELYPVKIYDSVLPPDYDGVTGKPIEKEFTAQNEAEFIEIIKAVLKHPRVTAIIQALMAQSEGNIQSEEDEIPF
jgi:hypothetical protein